MLVFLFTHQFQQINLFVRDDNIVFDIIPLNTSVFHKIGKNWFEKCTKLKTWKFRRSKEVKITKDAEIQNIQKYIFLIWGSNVDRSHLKIS